MTKAEKLHRDKTARLGCIVCLNNGHEGTPAELHHLRNGQGMGQRASEFEVLPLCPYHHRHGGYGNAIHAGQEAWERKNGLERDLLEQVHAHLGLIA